jgi:AAA15 family ATPase/GTPase
LYISNVVIKNFRALDDIHCSFGRRVNVIVGPNAIGKTTVLQAIRLVKGLLAPRSQNEAQQTLISLGAASPHFPQRLFIEALARDIRLPIEIQATFVLNDDEVSVASRNSQDITRSILQGRMGQSFGNPAALIQFIGSPQGQMALNQTLSELTEFINKLRSEKILTLTINTDPASGQIMSSVPLAGPILGYLDQVLPPYQSVFSYFPADRALPVGEVPVQLGAADTQQQLESHNSQPQLKYARMKNTVFNTLVMGTDERERLIAEFTKIFDGILHGRRIDRIGLNPLGMLSIMTEELETGRKIEIDHLSSGEKNLALTFLLIARSVAKGGIVLFDEPELHLNPAVCREVLEFILDQYAIPQDIQFIICTHSPEILAGAFSSDECFLFHLKSPSLVSRVGRRAIDEYSDALQRLGTSVSESLLYEGTLLVEGDDDVAFFETGFNEILKRFKVTDRGGRRQVERTVRDLQKLEAAGEKVAPIFLVFDRDDEVTELRSSASVRILQWERRCMENYLIDFDVITELLKRSEIAKTPVSDEGEVQTLLRGLAFGQLDSLVAREVYGRFGYLGPGLRAEDVDQAGPQEIASALFGRLAAARTSLGAGDEAEWKDSFLRDCSRRRAELVPIWEVKWPELCDGKRLFFDLQRKGVLKISSAMFKKRIIQLMKEFASENWRLVESLLKELVKL